MNNQRHLYLFALEVTPMEVGGTYDALPTHCTLMHRFWSVLDPAELAENVHPIFDQTPELILIVGEKAIFGPPPVAVNKIPESPELKALHTSLYDKLNEISVEYTAPQWVGKGYSAHITERENKPLVLGNKHLSEAVYLIEVNASGNKHTRHIRAKFDLKSPNIP